MLTIRIPIDEIRRARCIDSDPELWFPIAEDDPRHNHYAIKICRGCEIAVLCLREGLSEDHGIWGGFTSQQRAIIADQLDDIDLDLHDTYLTSLVKRASALQTPTRKERPL